MKEFLTQLAANTVPEGGLGSSVGDDTTPGGGMTGSSLFGDGGVVTTVINIILYIVGILAIIMLVYGGIQYVSSAGDEKKITAAKNTIIYAIVGLAIAILAWTITNFVFNSLGEA